MDHLAASAGWTPRHVHVLVCVLPVMFVPLLADLMAMAAALMSAKHIFLAQLTLAWALLVIPFAVSRTNSGPVPTVSNGSRQPGCR